MRNILSAAVLAMSISLVTTHSSSPAQEPAPPAGPGEKGAKEPPKPKPFSFDLNQIYVISTSLPGNPGAILTKATVVQIGTASFLSGEVPKDLQGWAQSAGTKVMLPIDIITQIVEYKDAEAVNKARCQTK